MSETNFTEQDREWMQRKSYFPAIGHAIAEIDSLRAKLAESEKNRLEEVDQHHALQEVSMNECDSLRAQLGEAQRQITMANRRNHERNVELDALHYVWCSGGCESGSHRFGEHPPLTQEIVETALRNTRRLVVRFENLEGRKLSNAEVKARWEQQQQVKAECDTLRSGVEQMKTTLEDIAANTDDPTAMRRARAAVGAKEPETGGAA